MRSPFNALNLARVTSEILTPRAFLALSPEARAKIQIAEVIPPGGLGGLFGMIRVYYKSPIFKAVHVRSLRSV